jgi:hypothetical protein
MDELSFVYNVLTILGGAGVVVIGLATFLSRIWMNRIKEQARQITELERERARRSTEIELEALRQQYEHQRIVPDRFVASQYEVYLQLWGTLQGLKLAVDALWAEANKENIDILADQLRHTRIKINELSLFFDDGQLENLREIINALENFRAGKVTLREIRTKSDLDYVMIPEVRDQIRQNHQYKQRIEVLMENLRHQLRDSFVTFPPLRIA